ncbi:MAG: helix-turn-helix domain-containing protein [Bacteriovoracaceae bacterium]|nr:helix-turn-helix domain-containing protein [Bacteriovoracaceae bacterium]
MFTRNFTKIPNRVIRSKILSKNAKVLFPFIASFNPSYPSYKCISEFSGLKGKTTIRNTITELQKYQLISYTKGHTGRSNLYQITDPAIWLIETDPVPKQDAVSPKSGIESVPNQDSNNTKIKKIINKSEIISNIIYAAKSIGRDNPAGARNHLGDKIYEHITKLTSWYDLCSGNENFFEAKLYKLLNDFKEN